MPDSEGNVACSNEYRCLCSGGDAWSAIMETRFDTSGVRAVDSSIDSVSSRLQFLDAELLLMGKALATANRRRNTLVAACRIPAEILSAIFVLAQISWLPSAENRGEDSAIYHYGWIHITHVCSYWRQVSCSEDTRGLTADHHT